MPTAHPFALVSLSISLSFSPFSSLFHTHTHIPSWLLLHCGTCGNTCHFSLVALVTCSYIFWTEFLNLLNPPRFLLLYHPEDPWCKVILSSVSLWSPAPASNNSQIQDWWHPCSPLPFHPPPHSVLLCLRWPSGPRASQKLLNSFAPFALSPRWE